MRPERSTEISAASRNSTHLLSDESLVEAAKRGHSMAFATLSERHEQQLFRAAYRITRSREDAEDAVQDTLLRAFVHMTDFHGRSSFRTWLTRIAINSALMILRKKRASPEIAVDSNDNFDADGLRYEISDHVPNPEKRYAQSEEESILKKAIQRLRPTLRVVVQLQQLQERSMREAAEAIGISLTATKGRLFHAKNALRRSLIPKLVHQPRFATGFAFCSHGNGSRRAKARMRFNDQQQSNHKEEGEEGEEHVIENKEKREYGVPSNLHSSGDRRGFERELGA
jgi:RNA polymerase sigma factor (sigma-70 family)